MSDVSWGGCSGGRVPARNRAGLGTVVGSGSPRRRSNMSGAGRKSSREGAEVRSEHTDWRAKEKCRGGHKWEDKGEGTTPDTLIQPPPHPQVTSWALGWVSNPTSAGGQETHLSGFTALSFFFGLKSKRDRQRQRGGGSGKPRILLCCPRSQAYSGSALKILVPTAVSHHAQHPQSLVSASSDVGPGWHLHSHWLCSSRDISPS